MNILCVGRNYARHADEMGGRPEAPIWFWKPETAIVHDGGAVRIPKGIGAVHHEVELAVRIGDGGQPDAMTVAVDVTARDLQAKAKKEGMPWTVAKGFDTFLPLGEWVPADDLQEQWIRLSVDGQLRQDGRSHDMTWNVDELLALAGMWTTLRPGDILLTGTPEGVGPIEPGEEMVAELVGHVRLRCLVVAR